MTQDELLLGIEIGGTKLQLGVGHGDGSPLVGFERREIEISRGAAGILAQIEEAGAKLLSQHPVQRLGIGFGGPVDGAAGRVIKSHQVAGWDGFPLAAWCQEKLGVPVTLGNDCDCAALAEARFGAGKGKRIVFYVTVGTGIGGGFVVHGQLHGVGRPAVAEIGHLRPGLDAESPECTVESLAAGPGIVRAALALCAETDQVLARDALSRAAGGSLDALTAKQVAEAAVQGHPIAQMALARAMRALGWALAQTITLTSAEVVVVGGGVSLLGERHFFQPLREQVAKFVFPPLASAYEIVPASLGEQVVVHGACALAKVA